MSKSTIKRKKSECFSSIGRNSSSLTYECDDRAKRQLVTQNLSENLKNEHKCKDTPQMRDLRKKMMSNSSKLSKIIRNSEMKASPKCSHNTSVYIKNDDQKATTPQIQLLQAGKSFDSQVTKSIQTLTSKSHTKVSDKISIRRSRAKSISITSASSESFPKLSDSRIEINNIKCGILSKRGVKKLRSCVTNEKVESIRSVEASPGVAYEKIIENGKPSINSEKNNDYFLDPALTSSFVLPKFHAKKARIDLINISSTKHSPAQSTINSTNNFIELKPNKKSSPNIYKNAADRLRTLRSRLSKKPQTVAGKCRLESAQQTDLSLESAINISNTFCEEMEWESTEEERIFYEIQSVRTQLNYDDMQDVAMNEISSNTFSFSEFDCKLSNRQSLYIVIDTNVFLTNLQIVEEARDTIFEYYGQSIVVIPWTTIRELDFIKSDKTNTRPENLKIKARQAIRFLNQHFSIKHPRMLGQTPNDVGLNKQKFTIECPDDEILQTCLQIQLSNNTVVLLSYDRNLCNKAMIHNIMTIGRNDNFEKINLMTEFDTKNGSSLAVNLKITNGDSRNILSPLTKELAIANDLYEEITTVLVSFLTIIVAKEMKKLFGDDWERYTIIKPPWTALTVLKCAIKHWIAAISESFDGRAQLILKELHESIVKLKCNRRLDEVGNIIHMCFDLVQCVKPNNHPNLSTKFYTAINELENKHQQTIKKIQEYQFNNKLSACLSDEVQESKAVTAFYCFECIYDKARDLCYIAAQSIDMPCTFAYKKNNTEMQISDVVYRRPEVVANINRMLLILATALEDVQRLNVHHRYVVALYNALETLYNSLQSENQEELSDILSPVDVYFCLKRRENLLKIGIGQFQELSNHFCRMASFKSA